jgi:predicted phage-related endonuclease
MTQTQTLERKIGGTLASAIVGCNPYKSRHSAWLDLTGRSEEIQDTPAMKRGRDSEDIIAQLYALRHQGEYKVVHNLDQTESPLQVIDKNKEYLIGHPDRILLDPITDEVVGGLEIKSAGLYSISKWGPDGSTQIPPHYYLQTQFYAGLCNIAFWPLFCAFFSNDNLVKDTREYPIVLDRELYGSLLEELDKFWIDYVLPDKEPEVDWADETFKQWVVNSYPVNREPIAEATEEEADLIKRYIELKERSEEYEKELETVEYKLKNIIGERDGLQSPFAKVTWKKSKDFFQLDKGALLDSLNLSEEIKQPFMKQRSGVRKFLVNVTK